MSVLVSVIFEADLLDSCIYQTTNILVHRPMVFAENISTETISNGDAMSICLDSASAICVILNLFFRTFGDGHCTMALAYSIYTAALVFLLRLESPNPIEGASQKGLEYCMRTLEDISAVHAGKSGFPSEIALYASEANVE